MAILAPIRPSPIMPISIKVSLSYFLHLCWKLIDYSILTFFSWYVSLGDGYYKPMSRCTHQRGVSAIISRNAAKLPSFVQGMCRFFSGDEKERRGLEVTLSLSPNPYRVYGGTACG